MEQNERYKIINGNSLEVLDTLEENSVDAIITDPPYELGFMGKKWDSTGIAYNVDLWKKAYRVIKSGGYLLAFGGSRTFHRIACAIEDAGFEIRDTIMWLYGSGFPKSMNIGLAIDKKNGVESEIVGTKDTPDLQDVGHKQKELGNGHIQSFGQIENAERLQYEIKKAKNEWNGWGTCLKPAYEPIIVARKPCEGSVVNNVLKYGTGGINIDECRIAFENGETNKTIDRYKCKAEIKGNYGWEHINRGANFNDETKKSMELGRFPSNVILTYDDTDFNEVCGGMPYTKGNGGEPNTEKSNCECRVFASGENKLWHKSGTHFDDEGSACRYFYCAKASKKDRDNGLDMLEEKRTTDGCIRSNSETTRTFGANSALRKNIHPTVKPCELMQYLVRLVTQREGVILDIFNGSGSTGKAVAFENRERNADYKYIGIELEKEYCEISKMRIDYAINKYQYDLEKDIKEEERKTGQMSLFDF